VHGNLKILLEGAAKKGAGAGLQKMINSGCLFSGAMSFEDVMTACARLESLVNGTVWTASPEEAKPATLAPGGPLRGYAAHVTASGPQER